MIKTENVTKWYDNYSIKALDNISIEISKGDFIFLLGSTGAGKTTLLQLFYRGILPTSGKVTVGGFDVANLSRKKICLLRRKIGVVFQDFKLLFNKTVYENVEIALRIASCSRRETKNKVEKVLKEAGLWYKRNYLPHKLSSGEQQKTAIARAIGNSPLILLADEPTGNLDSGLTDDIINMLNRINIKGTTVVVATHDKRLVKNIVSKKIYLEDGRIIC